MPFLLSSTLPMLAAGRFFVRRSRYDAGRATAAVALCRKLIFLTLGIHVYANLVVVLLIKRFPEISGQPPDSTYHLATTTTLMALVLYLAAALTLKRAALVIGGLQLLQVFVRVYAGGEELRQGYLDCVQGIVFGAVVLLYYTWLRQYGKRTDEALRVSVETKGAAYRLEGRIRAQREIAALVHDHVISALLLARPDSGAEQIVMQQEAKRALYVLNSHSDTDTSRKSVRLLYQTLQEKTAQLQSPVHNFEIEQAGNLSRTIPIDVWNALLLAASEAMRNVQRHAARGQTEVNCRILVNSQQKYCEVSVIDDGVGFDPQNTRTDRMGIVRSICERVENCLGGSVNIDSAPGRGTRVLLRWDDTETGIGFFNTHTRDALENYRPYMPLRMAIEHPWVGQVAGVFLLLIWSVGALQIEYYQADLRIAAGLCLISIMVFALLQHTNGVVGPIEIIVALIASTAMPMLVMSSWDGDASRWAGSQGWPLIYGTIALLPLLFRGRTRLAIGMFVLMCLSYCSGLALSGAALSGVQRWFIFAQAINFFFAWFVNAIVREIDQRLLVAQLQLEKNMQAVLQKEEEGTAREKIFGVINSYTVPLLVELAQIDPHDLPLRKRAIQLEARLRGLIRAPRLALNKRVSAAADAALSRGVEVALLDDFSVGGAGDWSDSLDEALIQQVVALIEQAASGDRVVVRLCPAHAMMRATLQWRQQSGEIEFLEIPWE